jgi:hypothetical protein
MFEIEKEWQKWVDERFEFIEALGPDTFSEGDQRLPIEL